jgi:hypothetical protein
MLSRFKQSKLFFWTAEIVLTIIGIYFLLDQTYSKENPRSKAASKSQKPFPRLV